MGEVNYKLLNKQLADEVQKLRLEVATLRKEVSAQRAEIMQINEKRILENARQWQQHIAIVSSLTRRLELDGKAESSQATEATQCGSRRSSSEMAEELRMASALARSSVPQEPEITKSTEQLTANVAINRPCALAVLEEQPVTEIEDQGQTQLTISTPPLPIADEDSYVDIMTISGSDSVLPFFCASPIEDHRNSANSSALDEDNPTEEQPSIQIPRLLVTASSPIVGSLMSSPSFEPDATRLGICSRNVQMSGTPISNRSSPKRREERRESGEDFSTTMEGSSASDSSFSPISLNSSDTSIEEDPSSCMHGHRMQTRSKSNLFRQ